MASVLRQILQNNERVVTKWSPSGHEVVIKRSPSGHQVVTRWSRRGHRVVVKTWIFQGYPPDHIRRTQIHAQIRPNTVFGAHI